MIFTWIPTYGSRLTVTPNVNTVKFGDGYEKRTALGLNTTRRVWQLSFSNRPLIVADAIEAFLHARGAIEAFDWTPPSGMPGKWVCRSWSVDPTSPRHRSLSATFEEVFEP